MIVRMSSGWTARQSARKAGTACPSISSTVITYSTSGATAALKGASTIATRAPASLITYAIWSGAEVR